MNQWTRCNMVKIELMRSWASSKILCEGITQVRALKVYFSSELSYFSFFFFFQVNSRAPPA